MKKFIILFLCIPMLFSFSACSYEKTDSKMYMQKAKLNKEEQNIANLLGSDSGSLIFDFKVDNTIKTISFNTYKLKDGKWELFSGGGGHAFNDAKGRIALTFENLFEGLRIAIQSENISSASEHTMPPTNEYENMSRATSALTDKTPIEYEKEIPLVIQVLTNKNTVNCYNVEYFNQPEKYQELGYEHVFAITVVFSQKTLNELDSVDEVHKR